MSRAQPVTDSKAEPTRLLSSERSGFYAARVETPSAAERLWPWVLVAVSILATLAAMAR